MKFHLEVDVTFDGTNMALEVLEITDYESTTVFLEPSDAGAKVIEFLRAKALDVYDRRLDAVVPELVEDEDEGRTEPEAEPDTDTDAEPEPEDDPPEDDPPEEPEKPSFPAVPPSLGPSRSLL